VTRERLNDLARTIIDSNRYMALGTADPDGHPWLFARLVRLGDRHRRDWWLMRPSTGPVRLQFVRITGQPRCRWGPAWPAPPSSSHHRG
jgi:Pyridoxamine 5'-phosphate oxidase